MGALISVAWVSELWDDDNEMILEQVADEPNRERNACRLPREHDAVDSTEAQFKDLPRRRGEIPSLRKVERSVTGRTDEGQSRRIVWEVCPVKRPLLSVAKITKAGNHVYLGEDKAFVKNNKIGQITNLPQKAQRVDA